MASQAFIDELKKLDVGEPIQSPVSVTPVTPTPREDTSLKIPDDGFVSGLILVTVTLIIFIFIRKSLVKMIRNFLTVLKKFISRVNPLYLILLLIALILFFGLFKNEIKIWKWRNWPAAATRVIEVQSRCYKDVENPAYTKYLKNLEYLEESECTNDQAIKELTKNGGKPERLIDRAVWQIQCKDNLQRTNPPPLKEIPELSTCTTNVDERWFFAFGRYWFKIK